MPEMGFTLGSLPELDDPDVRCLIAVDSNQELIAITSWLPMYRDNETVGWTLDFMRRHPAASPGIMEFLVATAALKFQQQGVQTMSLSGAPLARINRNDHRPGALHHVLNLLGRALEPAYGFRSLLAFKAKFQPTYTPLYMSYPDEADLPSIANAIGRAYLPHITGRQSFQLIRRLTYRRHPAKPRPSRFRPTHPPVNGIAVSRAASVGAEYSLTSSGDGGSGAHR